MAKTNLSLGNLYRATQGSARTTQAVSMNVMNASAGTTAALSSFAIDSVTVTPPTYTYIVESTSENATFTFGSAGSLHGTRVGSVAANYSVTFDNANFSVGSATLGATPSFPITPAAVGTTTYSEAQSVLSMKYVDGYNTAATNYNSTVTKTLYAVDVYNTINQPDFCLLFGTQVTTISGTTLNVEDLVIGDRIKAWVPAGLPDESQPLDSENDEWRFYLTQTNDGAPADVVVKDITFNFASGYYDINNGLVKATGTHPLWVYDSVIEKYHFKQVQDVIVGDKLISYNDEGGLVEVEVSTVDIVTEDVEIVTINVENSDVFLSNGVVSHNKGTTTQPYIPSSGLRMYSDPSKASSFPGGSLPATGTPTTDWLDLTGYGTGVRPAGVSNAAGFTGNNPSYNNGATRKEKYFYGSSNSYWYKDSSTNISGGYTNFNTSALTVIAWVRLPSHLTTGYYNIMSKKAVLPSTRLWGVFLRSIDGAGNYNVHESILGYNGTSTALSTNVWYMISYTAALNGTNVGYIDKTATGTIANGALDYQTFAAINVAGEMSNYTLTSHLGPVIFYNRQLSSTEIGQVYDYFSPSYK
jgi:hypothetical protein